MNKEEARRIAKTLLTEHGLTEIGWNFDFDNARRRLGVCVFQLRRITISQYTTEAATVEEFTQVMLHEVAHALVGAGAGHNAVWKLKAKNIGYTGERTSVNPYRRPGAADPGPLLPSTHATYRVGQMLELTKGQVGKIIGVGTSRYKVNNINGSGDGWFVPFAIAKLSSVQAPAATSSSPAIAGHPTNVRHPIGTRLMVGTQFGTVTKIANVQYHVRRDDGKLYGIRFASARLAPNTGSTVGAMAAAAPTAPVPAAPTALLTVGTKLRLHTGYIATIVKVAVKNYHADAADGEHWAIPFSEAREA
jgi:hypothetical protein